ncbi:MAG: bacterioferritin [Polaromonas sp.]|nr:bacterioferritin [Polaromonas sp.]
MRCDAQVVGYLQAQLKNELNAINQYFLHYRMYLHWGLDKAGEEGIRRVHLRKEACRQADGPYLHARWPARSAGLGKVLIGENVAEALACDLQKDIGAQATRRASMADCGSVRDFVSRDLLGEILDDTEEHIHFPETQTALVDKVGLHNYLQSQMGEPS